MTIVCGSFVFLFLSLLLNFKKFILGALIFIIILRFFFMFKIIIIIMLILKFYLCIWGRVLKWTNVILVVLIKICIKLRRKCILLSFLIYVKIWMTHWLVLNCNLLISIVYIIKIIKYLWVLNMEKIFWFKKSLRSYFYK